MKQLLRLHYQNGRKLLSAKWGDSASQFLSENCSDCIISMCSLQRGIVDAVLSCTGAEQKL